MSSRGRSAGRTCPPDAAAPSVPFATAPKIATPIAEPIDRQNMFVPVTTPRSRQATVDCAAMSVGEATRPMPRPITKHVPATWITEETSPSSNSNALPPSTSTAPISAHERTPIRR